MYIRKLKKSRVKFRVLAITALLAIGMFTAPANTTADTLSELRNQYSSLQKQQQQLLDKIASQNADLKSQQQQQDNVNKQIKLTQQQVDVLNAQVTGLNAQITATQQQIDAKQKQIESDYNLYKQRLRAMYESGDESYVVALLSAKDFTEFLSRVELVQAVSKRDQALVNNLKAEKDQLSASQANLQTQMVNLQSSQENLVAKQQVLNSQKAAVADLIAQKQNTINQTKQLKETVDQQAYQTDEQINEEMRRLAAQKSPNYSASAAAIIAKAESYLGLRYVLGAANPNYAFDCSGLTSYVFASVAGIYMPHQASEQAKLGTYVAKADLQPGDLVFFSDGGDISHVGIYLGNNAFIGAQNSTGVAVVKDMFNNSYWGPRFRFGRRILQ